MPTAQSISRRKPTLDNPAKKPGPKPEIEDHERRQKIIRGLAMGGMSYKEIAKTIGCSIGFLRANHKEDIENAKEIANALVSENLYRQAMKDNPASINAAIYITKARMGWADKKDDVSRAPPQVVFDFSGLSYEERMHLMYEIKSRLNGGSAPMLEGDYEEVEEEESDDENS